MRLNKLTLLLFFITLPAFAESFVCPTLNDIQKIIHNPNLRLSAYEIGGFKHQKSPWSIKPIEFKLYNEMWKLGIGPFDANSEQEAITQATQFLSSNDKFKMKPDSETNYHHTWCYYTDKNNRPMLFAITQNK